ncbi:D-inositol-3-phosphate glycosyltransferase [Nocardia sp. CNY236]|uniref:D-inositol-3-phosphate glycosyltransferase n=1 Tax=Nocardia sp. CNY236 TaxID=1169152 RepID=UPI000687AA3C|nr:D-inositol-3-phosphate glycosyltransferase [Nocardia sp. CNY236]
MHYEGVSQRLGRWPNRIAVLSVHTSPLAQPGVGDAGGMNVYILQTAVELARRGIDVEIFTRATSWNAPPVEQAAPGVLVRNVVAGPFEGLDKHDLPTQLCAFTAELLRHEAGRVPGYYDVVHSHYWLSGQVGWLVKDRWRAPLVHTAHTLAAVKNAALAEGDSPEPATREIGEKQVITEADRLVANTAEEARQLVGFYGADSERIDIAPPGADLAHYRPGDRDAARRALGLAAGEQIVAFVGRIQPLKAPDVLVRAAAEVLGADPRRNLRVLIVGGQSGSGLEGPRALLELASELGIADRVSFLPPQPPEQLVLIYRAADLVAVPSYNESFGLVALEAQASGTPVLAADVGGLGTAVRHEASGVLVRGHRTQHWADALRHLLDDPDRLLRMGARAVEHAGNFSWAHTADGLLASYAAALAGRAEAGAPSSERIAALLGESSQARSQALWRRRTGARR